MAESKPDQSVVLTPQERQDAINALRLSVKRDGVKPADSWMVRYLALAEKLTEAGRVS